MLSVNGAASSSDGVGFSAAACPARASEMREINRRFINGESGCSEARIDVLCSGIQIRLWREGSYVRDGGWTPAYFSSELALEWSMAGET